MLELEIDGGEKHGHRSTTLYVPLRCFSDGMVFVAAPALRKTGEKLKHSETQGGKSDVLKHFETFTEILRMFVTAHLFLGLRNRGRLDHTPKEKLDLNQLRARLREKPRTKAGQVRQAWPEIKALFDAGHSLKDIWVWLNEIGIEIGYTGLSHYTAQLKRLDRNAVPASPNAAPVPEESRPEAVAGSFSNENDPLANIREREERPPGFQYNAEPDIKKLI